MTTYTVTPFDLQGVAPNGQAFAIKRTDGGIAGAMVSILFKQPDGTWTVKVSPAVIDMNTLQTVGAAAAVALVIGGLNFSLRSLFPAGAAPAPAPADDHTLEAFDAALASTLQIGLVDGVPQISARQ